MLIDKEGHRYTQNGCSKNTDKVYWRCTYFAKRNGSCPGKAVTAGFYIVKKCAHIHEPNVPIVHLMHGNSKEARLLKQLKEENKS